MAMSMLLSGQWVIENIFKFETTLSVVINFIGGLYFLSLLVRQKKFNRETYDFIISTI